MTHWGYEQGLLALAGGWLGADKDVLEGQAGEGMQGSPLAHQRGQVAQPQQVPAAVCLCKACSHCPYAAPTIRAQPC